ncbi:response regulator transcription factor [Tenacibaculum agarivorans]|uniref:response regulator transcription factor n=1 Tax=Tenacibaculum agarivorans TaxID=1908389 RepID=UPI0009FACC54|nr:response regulator transcription factor [Tenacibaculum agarivorans]
MNKIQSMTTFIVEDQLIVSEEIKEVMEDLEYKVIGSSKSWKIAFKEINHLRPDILLLDIMLNDEKDGIALAKEIRKIYTPYIFFLTAYADKKTIKRAQEVQPNGYIVKPIHQKSLFAALEMGIDSENLNADINEAKNLFSAREIEVINYISKGLTEDQIGEKLFISNHTVKSHKKNIFKKSNVSSVVELTVFAFKNQLI